MMGGRGASPPSGPPEPGSALVQPDLQEAFSDLPLAWSRLLFDCLTLMKGIILFIPYHVP